VSALQSGDRIEQRLHALISRIGLALHVELDQLRVAILREPVTPLLRRGKT
jgi:hypothetical protein